MDVSYRWLQALAPTLTGTPQAVADRLAMLGAPVDEVLDLGAEIGDVVIARVAEVRAHPNADKLRICTVDAGAGEPLQVVCGAPNVEAGGLYPFAPIGATLPGGLSIKKAKLRGETSEGMLCSARELGLGRDHAGLMTLRGDFAPGASFREALGLDDARLTVDVTPNRSELLSHVGVAREAAPGGMADVRLPVFPGGRAAEYPTLCFEREGEGFGVRVGIDDPEGCPRYMAAVVKGVRIAPSPEWLATRLRAVGLRPINNVVDATNYVMLELGQPLHAFDLSRVHGGEIRVRRAAEGEGFTTLDGVERVLSATDVMIADGERSVAIAGVMGGANSEVGDDTADLLLECALFDARAVRKTARRLGLSTDASYRFERGVDPEGQPAALRRVIELILAVAGGEAVGAIDVNPVPYARRVVELRPERVRQLLGVSLSGDEVARLIGEIGFEVEDASASPLRVRVPGWRPDVEEEVDLIEEVARRRGYGTFDEEVRPYRPTEVPEDPRFAVEERLRALFLRWGFLEARAMAFAPGAGNSVAVLNPLSAEEGFLRSSLVPGLLRRAEHNFAHGVRDVRLFATATVFAAGEAGGVPHEELRVAALLTGARRPGHWSTPAEAFDVWDLKGLLEELAEEYAGGSVTPGEQGAIPLPVTAGTALRLDVDGAALGGGGQVAADSVDAPAWAAPVFVLEARVPAAALDRRGVRYRALPEFPASDRDLALLVPDAVAAETVGETVRESAGRHLEAAFPFDLYAGKGVPEGTRSIAWRLRFRKPEGTLTEAEVEGAVQKVLAALEERHGVRRR